LLSFHFSFFTYFYSFLFTPYFYFFLEDVAARVSEHLRAGADQVGLNVITASPGVAPLRQWSDLAAAITAQ